MAEDAERGLCQWCRLWVGTADGRHLIREPRMLRWYVLNDLTSLASLMFTFGIGQTVIAVTYFWFFFGCGPTATRLEPLPLVLFVAIGVVLFVGGVFIIAGSMAVRYGRQRLFAVVGAIFTLTSPLIIGLPVGIWALWKLNRPEVKAAFGMRGG